MLLEHLLLNLPLILMMALLKPATGTHAVELAAATATTANVYDATYIATTPATEHLLLLGYFTYRYP
jgi:hypothetical protein